MDTLMAWLQPLMGTAFTLFGSPATWAELLAFLAGVAMVVLNMRVNPWAWPLAIFSALIYFVLFWQYKLYGDASLQIFFAVVGAWGWWQWLRGSDEGGAPLRVRHLPRRLALPLAGLTLAAWPLLGLFLDRYTDTDVPYWDAFPTAASLTGQWLLGRQYVENWPTWMVVNAVSVALFAYKGLWLTVLLYTLFFAMALAGWRAWQRRAAPAVA